MENLYSCSQTGERWSALQDAWKIDWSEGLRFQLIVAQKSVDVQLLVASSISQGSVQRLVLLNAFINDQDNEMDFHLSKFVDGTKLLGIDDTLQDRAAMEESHQRCCISIITSALKCGLLISG